MMDWRSSGESSSMMSARSAGCSWASLSLERRSFTRRRGSGSIRLTNSQRMVRLRKLFLDAADAHRRDDPLQQAANRAGQADVHLRDAKLGVAVDALIGQIDIVDANDFAAVGVDDLLVEQVLLDGEPRFVGMIELECRFVGGEPQAARGHRGDLVEARHERPVLAAADQQARNAVRLLVRDDEHFLDAADEIAE